MNFVLIGAAGFVAPRHMKAIKETGNNLIACIDKHDNVGVLDSYFPEADFFTEFEVFDRHIHKLKRDGISIDYVSVCTPNYLHDSHIRYGLRIGANVICEKPMVIKYHNLEALKQIESETGKKVFSILQLRLNPALNELNITQNHYIEIKYYTPRGKWYHYSWKSDKNKSGGLIYNIGIHLFDLLIFLFGEVKLFRVIEDTETTVKGILELELGFCRFDLSINGDKPIRKMTIDGKEVDLNNGFTDAHTRSYQEILDGNGFGIDEAGKAIKLLCAE